MKNKVKEMEDEAEKLRKIQEQVVEEQLEGGEGGGEDGATEEADARSIYVGQVDYSATPEELQEHFASCGTVNRVTILCDRYGNPKVNHAGMTCSPPQPQGALPNCTCARLSWHRCLCGYKHHSLSMWLNAL